jgi:hypothetical protein
MTTDAAQSARRWARDEFGRASLGNQLRTQRLVQLAAGVAEMPAGRVTEVFQDAAGLEGAYRFLESEHVAAEAIGIAAGETCARRCRTAEVVYVPVDATSLTLPDPHEVRALGAVGNHLVGQHGLQVMSAIAVASDGTPMGLLAQAYWARARKPVQRHRRRRRLADKETRYWLEAVDAAQARWRAAGARGRLWFQLDRGGDFWEMLQYAANNPQHGFTIRAAYDRRVRRKDATISYLWRSIAAQPVLGQSTLEVPAGRERHARIARLSIRVAQVTLWVRARPSKVRKVAIPLRVVFAREAHTTPRGEKPLEWMLFTTAPVATVEDAQRVIFGYTRRWRVEEFHKTWKSTCRVEETQLRDPERIKRWATILAAVATRIQRLTHLARTAPETPATEELSRHEIDAVLLLKAPERYGREGVPHIDEVVRWIAELGGYRGKSSGGPPGAIVIGRGLQRIKAAAAALRNLPRSPAGKGDQC